MKKCEFNRMHINNTLGIGTVFTSLNTSCTAKDILLVHVCIT